MSAVRLACSQCKASLTLKGEPPPGVALKCPKCGAGLTPPPTVTDADPTPSSVMIAESMVDRTQDAPTRPVVPDVDDEDDPLVGLLAPPQQPDEVGRLAHFRVLGLLGMGGMGAVFRA